jgi:twitching motility two-component system response regulator PilG
MNAPNRLINKRRARLNHEDGDIVILCAEEELRDAIAYWLSSRPAKAVVADDGYHAAKVLQNGCQWLVTDRVLPPWPGLDNFLTLRSTHPQLRIAFIENGNLDDRILARVTGADVLLRRPLSRKTVSDALALTLAP